MPFSIKIDLGTEHSLIFEGWIEDVFGKYVPKGTAFANARGPEGPGQIVTNGPMVLSTKAPLVLGASIESGRYVAYGTADGEDIPYGKPFSVFVPETKP